MRLEYFLYNESFEITNSCFFEEGSQPENSTLKKTNGELKPMYNVLNDIIYEGATQQEIDEYLQFKKDEFTLRINEKVDELNTRALSSALGQKGSRSYLDSQRQIYQEKLDVAKGKVNSFMEGTISDQMDRDYPNETDLNNALIALGVTPVGPKLKKYKDLIVATNEKKETDYSKFISYIEDFRTIAKSHLNNNDFVKAQAVYDVANSVPIEVNDEILTTKRAEALNI